MKPKKATVANIVLALCVVIAGIIALTQYNAKADLNKDITELESELASEKEYNQIHDLTETFIEKSSGGDHADLLTGQAKERLEQALENKGRSNHNHGTKLIEDIKLFNVSASKTSTSTAESYAIYRVFYGISEDMDTPKSAQQIQTLTMKADWKKTDDGYKVHDYQINLLKDSLDEHIKEMQEKRDESENEDE